MARLRATPYYADTVNHATNDNTEKIRAKTEIIDTRIERNEKLRRRREQYCARRDRETIEEGESRLEVR